MHASVPHGAALAPADCQQGRPASLAVMIPLRSRAPPSCGRRRHPDECRHARVLYRCCSIFRRCALQKECWLLSTPEQTQLRTPLLVSGHEKTLLENPMNKKDSSAITRLLMMRCDIASVCMVANHDDDSNMSSELYCVRGKAKAGSLSNPAENTNLTEQSKSICPFPGPSFMIVGAVLLASGNSA